MSGPLRESLETTLASDPKLSQPENAALVNLCRMLADQCDQAGADVSSRLSAAYLSALKDVRRAMSETGGEEAGGGKLAQLRSVQAKQPAKSATRRRAG